MEFSTVLAQICQVGSPIRRYYFWSWTIGNQPSFSSLVCQKEYLHCTKQSGDKINQQVFDSQFGNLSRINVLFFLFKRAVSMVGSTNNRLGTSGRTLNQTLPYITSKRTAALDNWHPKRESAGGKRSHNHESTSPLISCPTPT